VISVSAIGSLRQQIEPGHAITIDQIIDRTKSIRKDTYFGNGVVGHVSVADPLCPVLRKILHSQAQGAFPVVHDSGTYIAIEGPRFSTRAESHFFRSIGGDVIGMTAYPEAILAREAGLHYATLALVTDFDCWKDDRKAVTVEEVMKIMNKNVNAAKSVLKNTIAALANQSPSTTCPCEGAGKNAVITPEQYQNPETLKDIGMVLG